MRILVPALLALAACQPGPPDNAAEIAGNAEAGIVTPEPGETAGPAEAAAASPATANVGPLRIRYDQAAGHVHMGGPAAFVFEGTLSEGTRL